MVQAVKNLSLKTIVVASSSAGRDALLPFIEQTTSQPAVFVAHVADRPTIGVQDTYATALGYPVTRLLPAGNALLQRCWQQQQTLQQAMPALKARLPWL